MSSEEKAWTKNVVSWRRPSLIDFCLPRNFSQHHKQEYVQLYLAFFFSCGVEPSAFNFRELAKLSRYRENEPKQSSVVLLEPSNQSWGSTDTILTKQSVINKEQHKQVYKITWKSTIRPDQLTNSVTNTHCLTFYNIFILLSRSMLK